MCCVAGGIRLLLYNEFPFELLEYDAEIANVC